MQQSNFTYEVAFSFLQQDEAVAAQINDLVKDRLSTFLYTDQQKRLGGNDGEIVFNRVFGNEARLVVVFYRKGWGDQGWTRVEQTAIRNRGFEEGHEFCLFIPMDDPPTVPAWLPKTQIWFNLKRFGNQGAASIVEEKVKERGGEARRETVVDHAARVLREQTFAKEREQFLRTDQGVKAADSEYDTLINMMSKLVANPALQQLSLGIKRINAREADITSKMGCLSIDWERVYANTLDGAKLTVQRWRGTPPRPGRVTFDKPTSIGRRTYTFDLTATKDYVWADSERQLNTAALADECLHWLLEVDGSRTRSRGVTWGR